MFIFRTKYAHTMTVQLIFSPVKADMPYISTVKFGAPIWCPRGAYFAMNNRILVENYVKNHGLS